MASASEIRVVIFLVWAFLVANSLRKGLIRRYPLVFVYIFANIAFDIEVLALARWLGVGSIYYSYAYSIHSLISISLAAAVLLHIYSVLGRMSIRRDWHLLVGSLLVGLLGVLDSHPVWPLFRLINIGYGVLVWLGAATLLRMLRAKRKVDLGWNLKMALLALTLPACFYALSFAAFTVDLNLPYEAARSWLTGTALAFWIILAIGFAGYSPPRPLQPQEAMGKEVGSGKWEIRT